MRRFGPTISRATLRSTSRPTSRPSIRPSWRHVVQRGYASEGSHESHSSGSDLPWAIGSAAVFFPSAYYLVQQAPEKSSHSHGGEHEGEHEDGEEESKEEGEQGAGGEEESSTQEADTGSSDEPADTTPQESSSEDAASQSGGDSGDSESDDSTQTPETSDDEDSADDEGQGSSEPKAKKNKSTLDKRREPTSEVSKSQHPYMGEPGKSTKSEGVHETAKLSGTVDPFRKSK